jgi:glycosyltransferase involved in cell wall biosynthesis
MLGYLTHRDNVEQLQINEDAYRKLYTPIINKVLKDRKIDLYHYPYFNCPFPINTTKIITIHDVNPLIEPKSFKYNKMIWPYYKFLLDINKRRVNKIITISEFARKSIIELLDIPCNKVIVIYHGIEEKFFPRYNIHEKAAIREKYGLSEDYLLYVGNLLPHKNVPMLLRAYSDVSREISSDMVIIGYHDKFFKEIERLANELNARNRIRIIKYVEEKDMPLIYAYSKAFVSLSRLEGFGLPLLEAMASGIPAVVSNRCSFPEIAGEAALVVNIDNPSEIREAIIRVDRDKEIRRLLSKKGIERAKQFSWERCAEETLKAYIEATY